MADNPEASTVNVAFEAGFTEFGEIEQVGAGAVPFTAQERAIAAEKPPCAAKLSTSLTLVPAFNVRLESAAVTLKSGGGRMFAVTIWFEFSVTLQELGLVPVHAPLQLENWDEPEGVAVRVTCVPGRFKEEQVPPVSLQEMDPSLEATDPVPPPVTLTLSAMPRTMFAVTVLLESITIEQPELFAAPAQAPPQLWSSDPASMLIPRLAVAPLR